MMFTNTSDTDSGITRMSFQEAINMNTKMIIIHEPLWNLRPANLSVLTD